MSDTAVATATVAQAPAHPTAWKSASGFGFRDILDIINPLQHLPIISSIYRWVTGDRPGEAAKIAGDALYGGPIGVGFGLIGAAMEDSAGHDLGERTLSAMFDSDKKPTMVAAAAPPAGAKASTATPALSVAAPAVPDHPPIPLFGGVAQMPPAAPSPKAPQDDAAHEFLARRAEQQRQLAAGSRAPGATSAPVPLMVPAGALPAGRPMNAPAPVAAPVATTVAGPPLDVSQKMLDALDKYMKLQQERKSGTGPSDQPAPPSVDLSL